MMYGMDISHYQSAIDLSKGQYDFCIIKATEGYAYIDKAFYKYADELIKLNKLIGCYHYCRPDFHGTVDGMIGEARHFVDIVESADLLNKSLLVMDWEVKPFDDIELILAFLEEIEKLSGQIPIIYGSKSKLETYGWTTSKKLSKYPIWLAKYPSKMKFEVGKNPALIEPTISYRDWSIWQYTDNGQYPGYNGNVDLDCCIGGEQWWATYSRKISDKVAPYLVPNDVSPTEILSESMKWAISIGLFVGYGNGRYGPNQALTRNEAAMLFERYTRYLQTHTADGMLDLSSNKEEEK